MSLDNLPTALRRVRHIDVDADQLSALCDLAADLIEEQNSRLAELASERDYWQRLANG
jgi:chemotaxis protein histidine kinase CheA